MKIRWTPEARITYLNVLDYLQKNWGIKEIQKFVNKTEKVLKQITKNPQMFRYSGKKDIRIGLITKQISLIYKVKSTEIELLTFWDNRQNSK